MADICLYYISSFQKQFMTHKNDYKNRINITQSAKFTKTLQKCKTSILILIYLNLEDMSFK